MGIKILDTSILIDHLRGYKPATQYLDSLNDKETAISVITEAEVLSGESCNNSSIRESISHLLSRWKHIDVSRDIAIQTGDIKRKYRLTMPDALIAATALLHGLEVSTKNVKDFAKVEGIVIKAPY